MPEPKNKQTKSDLKVQLNALEKENKILKEIFNDTIWMALRYADGRHTYAPSIIRDSVKKMEEIDPEWSLRTDITIHPPSEVIENGLSLKSDYLYDLLPKKIITNI